tara:strand:+ start:2011 stop:3369 length:1359 start_codon:yes stop_codon:yes gene_type:complete
MNKNYFLNKAVFSFDKILMTSILSLPFTIEVLFDFGAVSVLLIPITLYFLDIKVNPSKYFVFFILCFLFYNNIIYYDTHLKLHELRLRYFSSIFLLISFCINLICLKNKNVIKYVNVFFLFLSISFVATKTYNSFSFFDRSSFLEKLNFEYKASTLEIGKSDDPVILIILDELSSSEEIFKHTKDSIDLKLDFYLEERGYKIISNARTESLRTTISLPSLFNFNLHNSIDKDSIENIDKGLQTIDGFKEIFAENLLVDSLLTKSVKSYSFGIGEFTRGINSDDFCYLWGDSCYGSSLNDIVSKTIIETVINGLDRDTKKIDLFRKNALDQLENLVPKQKSFYYFHLFFPHDPYSYYEEYPNVKLNYLTISEEEYLSEHIKYNRWFVDKFINLIEDANFQNSRIIIAGDHGFRYNKSIAPELTNIYLKGYNSINTNNDITVQQIGNIILESFF